MKDQISQQHQQSKRHSTALPANSHYQHSICYITVLALVSVGWISTVLLAGTLVLSLLVLRWPFIWYCTFRRRLFPSVQHCISVRDVVVVFHQDTTMLQLIQSPTTWQLSALGDRVFWFLTSHQSHQHNGCQSQQIPLTRHLFKDKGEVRYLLYEHRSVWAETERKGLFSKTNQSNNSRIHEWQTLGSQRKMVKKGHAQSWA